MTKSLRTIAKRARAAHSGIAHMHLTPRQKRGQWIAYGAALLAARAELAGDRQFGEWVRAEQLDGGATKHQQVRAAAMWLAEAHEAVFSAPGFDACRASNPVVIQKWWRERQGAASAPTTAEPGAGDVDAGDVDAGGRLRGNVYVDAELRNALRRLIDRSDFAGLFGELGPCRFNSNGNPEFPAAIGPASFELSHLGGFAADVGGRVSGKGQPGLRVRLVVEPITADVAEGAHRNVKPRKSW